MKRIREHNYATKKGPGYYRVYEERFQHLRDKEVVLLELGIGKGGSLEAWRDFFPHGTIIGLDKNPIVLPKQQERIHIYQGLQNDTQLLDRIKNENVQRGFDIIIDDASHIADDARASFWHLLEHLKPGGFYVIEDWGTGYWDTWPDGAAYTGNNHTAGMVGFVKELLDEVGSPDYSPLGKARPLSRPSRLKSMDIRFGMVWVEKASL